MGQPAPTDAFAEFPTAGEMIGWAYGTASGWVMGHLLVSVSVVAVLVVGYFGWAFLSAVRAP